MPDLIPFQFHAITVSTITDAHGDPWFLAKDVCQALAITNVSQALSRLKSSQISDIILNDVTGREQEHKILSESGLYKLAMKSRKKIAEEFQDWVTEEVLPTIRKTGSYQPQAPQVKNPVIQMLIDMAVQLDAAQALATEANGKADLALRQQQWLTLREYGYLHKLEHTFSDGQWAAFGRYLTGYCLEHGIPVRKQGIADRGYGTEHAYHVEVIHSLLHPWMVRHSSGQVVLDLVKKEE
jgi:prophage antirepressor-like protein